MESFSAKSRNSGARVCSLVSRLVITNPLLTMMQHINPYDRHGICAFFTTLALYEASDARWSTYWKTSKKMGSVTT